MVGGLGLGEHGGSGECMGASTSAALASARTSTITIITQSGRRTG